MGGVNIMKRSIKIMFLFAIILFLGLTIGCTNRESSARSKIRDLTGIELPNNSEIIFHHEEDFFSPVPGRRSQYSVFKFEEIPIEFLSDANFQEGRNANFEELFDMSFSSYSHAFDTPSEYHPNWDSEYLWLDTSSGVYFIYFTGSNLLIVYIIGA
jgi:hypothetical protein